MDPDVTLREIRELVKAQLTGRLTDYQSTMLAENVGALDEWLSGGGFLPGDWNAHCRNLRHGTPCPLPCEACAEECK